MGISISLDKPGTFDTPVDQGFGLAYSGECKHVVLLFILSPVDQIWIK